MAHGLHLSLVRLQALLSASAFIMAGLAVLRFATSLGATAASSAVAGGVIGVGAAALIHAAVTPCTGFHALAGGEGCVNGQYVGYRGR